MAVAKPAAMTQEGWDYLLKFTSIHEHPVPHMYNNKQSEGAKQDVSFGIGIYLSSPQAALGYKKYFKVGGSQASDGQITADWEAASKILRKGASVAEYAAACVCRVSNDDMADLMAEKLRSNLEANLKIKPQLSTFLSYPVQAQIACASYFYGHILPPKMGNCVDNWDFYQAGVESHLNGMSGRKYKAHVTLFQNAAQIVAQGLDYKLLPNGFDPPDMIAETVSKESAKATGLAMATGLKVARAMLPFALSPLFIPLPGLTPGSGSTF